jgi:hypothetical protein
MPSKPNSVYDASAVVISMPEIGCTVDIKGFLNHFKPGLGSWWEGQLKLGRYALFPQCQVAVLLFMPQRSHPCSSLVHSYHQDVGQMAPIFDHHHQWKFHLLLKLERFASDGRIQ